MMYQKIKITNLKNGTYGTLLESDLKFDGQIDMLKDFTNFVFFEKIEIDKKSALNITHTLLDSLGLLDKNAEELLFKIEDKIYEEEQ